MNDAKRGGDSQSPRLTAVTGLLMITVMVTAAVTTFVLSAQGKEETQVPAVVGDTLLVAMEHLQEKGLIARVEGRFSSNTAVWQVMDQNPVAGSMVKAGRPVLVVVSRGRVITQVGNYLDRDVDEVRLELLALSPTGESIKIVEHRPRISDPRPAGTILGQSPDPGTEISKETTIRVTVSRGSQGDLVEVPQFIGMTYPDALAVLADRSQTFVFTVREGGTEDQPGTVVFQSPDGGTEAPHSTVLQVGITRPDVVERDLVFGLFEYEVERYPILVDLQLSAEIPDQLESLVLLSTRYEGGPIAIPFLVPADTQLVLTVLGRPVDRRQAKRIAID